MCQYVVFYLLFVPPLFPLSPLLSLFSSSSSCSFSNSVSRAKIGKSSLYLNTELRLLDICYSKKSDRKKTLRWTEVAQVICNNFQFLLNYHHCYECLCRTILWYIRTFLLTEEILFFLFLFRSLFRLEKHVRLPLKKMWRYMQEMWMGIVYVNVKIDGSKCNISKYK